MKCSQVMQQCRPSVRLRAAPSNTPIVPQGHQANLVAKAHQYYEQVWSTGDIRLLNSLMAENHEQLDMVWQPGRANASGSSQDDGGLKRMKRGILAYRAAYPDLKFSVNCCSPPFSTPQGPSPAHHSVFVHWQAQGTNLGSIRESPPTGRRAKFDGISRLDFNEDGLIIKSHVFRQASADEAAYFSSAGLLPWQINQQGQE